MRGKGEIERKKLQFFKVKIIIKKIKLGSLNVQNVPQLKRYTDF